jgi:hypothetical protein
MCAAVEGVQHDLKGGHGGCEWGGELVSTYVLKPGGSAGRDVMGAG